MFSFIPHHRQSGRQRLIVVLLLGLLLGLGQVLLSTHAHAGDLTLHEDCVLCHQHGAGFDATSAASTLPYFGRLTLHTPFRIGTAPHILPLAPRARSPPLAC